MGTWPLRHGPPLPPATSDRRRWPALRVTFVVSRLSTASRPLSIPSPHHHGVSSAAALTEESLAASRASRRRTPRQWAWRDTAWSMRAMNSPTRPRRDGWLAVRGLVQGPGQPGRAQQPRGRVCAQSGTGSTAGQPARTPRSRSWPHGARKAVPASPGGLPPGPLLTGWQPRWHRPVAGSRRPRRWTRAGLQKGPTTPPRPGQSTPPPAASASPLDWGAAPPGVCGPGSVNLLARGPGGGRSSPPDRLPAGPPGRQRPARPG